MVVAHVKFTHKSSMPRRANQESFLTIRWASCASTKSNGTIIAMLKGIMTTTGPVSGKMRERSAGERQQSCKLTNLSKLITKEDKATMKSEGPGKFLKRSTNNTFDYQTNTTFTHLLTF